MLTAPEQKRLKRRVAEDNARLVEIFDTLSDANRCQLFRLVASRADLNVSEAAQLLNLSVPLASQHFKILASSQLILRHKSGRQVFYRLNDQDSLVADIVRAIKSS